MLCIGNVIIDWGARKSAWFCHLHHWLGESQMCRGVTRNFGPLVVEQGVAECWRVLALYIWAADVAA